MGGPGPGVGLGIEGPGGVGIKSYETKLMSTQEGQSVA